jgi:radical SAM superfamily enzyme YgiQ (UPF0313 family)
VLSGILGSKYNVRVLDAIVTKMKKEEALKKILNMDIDTIIFLTGAVSWIDDLDFIEEIRRQKDVTTIAIGDIMLYHGLQILEEKPFLDAVLLNFITFDIVDFLEHSSESKKINNLIYKNNGKIITGDKYLDEGTFKIPIPLHHLFPLEKYEIPQSMNHPISVIMTDFGCPFECIYCPAANLPYRKRDIENTIEELKYIQSLKIKEVFIRDLTFAANHSHAIQLCTRMLEEKIQLKWFCETRIDLMNEELLGLMKRSGCHAIWFGIETKNNAVLKNYGKVIDLEKTRKIFKLCKKLNIKTSGWFIIGLPGETKESILETINFAKELDCDYVSFNMASPRVGTKFRHLALKEGWVIGEEKTLDSSVAYPLIHTDRLSRQQIWELRNYAIRSFYLRPSYVIKRILKLNSFRTFKVLMKNCIEILRTLFLLKRDNGD